MELKIKDVVNILQVSEKTVYRWIKDKKIPCYKINHQYRFNRAEINEWIISNRIELSSSLINLSNTQNPESFSILLERGEIINIETAGYVKDILKDAVGKINTPGKLSKEEILDALIRREELMPTAIGNGISIPHPRNPIVIDVNDANISICYLSQPVEFGALDKKPVHTMFILLTSSPRMHLDVLSKISYLSRDKKFLDLLERKAEKEEILKYVYAKEADWQKMRHES